MTETREPYLCQQRQDPQTVLEPVKAELDRALAAVLDQGFGQVTLVVEHGEVRRVVANISLMPGKGVAEHNG